jgi:hypothetical protein
MTLTFTEALDGVLPLVHDACSNKAGKEAEGDYSEGYEVGCVEIHSYDCLVVG